MPNQRNRKAESSQTKSSASGQSRHGQKHNGSHPDRGSSRGQHGRGGEQREQRRSQKSASGRRSQSSGGGHHEQPDQEKAGIVSRAAGGIRGAGAKTVDTVKQHPVTTALIGAGVAAGISVLAWRALRGSQGSGQEQQEREPQDMGQEHEDAGQQAQGSYEGEEGEGEGEEEGGEEEDEPEASREGDDESDNEESRGLLGSRLGGALKGGASAAQQGYEYGKEKLGGVWHDHPLMTGAGILALGIAAGMLLPGTGAEKKMFGRTSGKLTDKIRSAGRELLEQGKQAAGKVVTEAGSALRDEVEKEGLSPDKLARKVKRIAGRIKDVISDATE